MLFILKQVGFSYGHCFYISAKGINTDSFEKAKNVVLDRIKKDNFTIRQNNDKVLAFRIDSMYVLDDYILGQIDNEPLEIISE